MLKVCKLKVASSGFRERVFRDGDIEARRVTERWCSGFKVQKGWARVLSPPGRAGSLNHLLDWIIQLGGQLAELIDPLAGDHGGDSRLGACGA